MHAAGAWRAPRADLCAVCRAKGTSSGGEQSSSCEAGPHLVSATLASDPCPDSGSPTVPGASMLSGSSLDISAALPHKGSPKSKGDHSGDASTCRTDVTPSTDASITSVICAATNDPRGRSSGDHAGLSWHKREGLQGHTAEQIARRSLEECRQDIEDEHLEVEGVIGRGRRGTVFWGTWRGLEVAIKGFEFEARFRSALRNAHACLL